MSAATDRRKPMRLVLLGDPRKGGIKNALDDLLPWLEERATVVAVDLDGQLDLCKVSADAVIVLGGDGAVLHTAGRMGTNQIPLVGINYGRLGFLAETAPHEAKQALECILSGDHQKSRRLMLECELRTKNGEQRSSLVVNEVVAARETFSPMTSIRLEIAGERVASYWGDGLIVSTPGGSTAYSLSAGGPILYPEMAAFLITPVSVHALTIRPIVTMPNVELRFQVQEGDAVAVIIDGQANWEFAIGDELLVRRAKETFTLLQPKGYNYYHSLYTKLHWGKTTRESSENNSRIL